MYELKHIPMPRKKVDKVCITCGKREPSSVPVYPNGVTPNTAYSNPVTSKLRCALGMHLMYFEYELVKKS